MDMKNADPTSGVCVVPVFIGSRVGGEPTPNCLVQNFDLCGVGSLGHTFVALYDTSVLLAPGGRRRDLPKNPGWLHRLVGCARNLLRWVVVGHREHGKVRCL